jgi:thymidylate synthase (FAD)
LNQEITVRVVAYTQFLGVPAEMYDGQLPEDTDHGSDIARYIECAGRECYDSYKAKSHRDSASYHEHIKQVGHGSVTGHGEIGFYIAGISRNLSHELVRHSVGCEKSQRSSRYCNEAFTPIAWHPLLGEALQESEWELLTALVESCRHTYNLLMSRCEEHLLQRGVSKGTARKQARGAARGILPSALETGLIWTVNIRALRHILEQRCQDAADAEIRLLMNKVYLLAREVCPEYFNDYTSTPAEDGIGFCLKTDYRKI